MEKRFGIKDLVLFSLIAVLIVLVLLGMKQYDRQWETVQSVQTKLNEQTGDLARIERMLRQGGIAMGSSTQPSGAMDVDYRVRKNRSAPDFAEGDTVVDVFSQIPDKLTPLISTDLYSQYVQGYVLDTLLDRDPNTLEWIPRLANKWSVSPDGKIIDFTIRPNVTFSNGDPLTADDVVYTMEMTMNEAIEARHACVHISTSSTNA